MTWRRLTARAWGDSVKLELKIHAALPFDATLSLTMTLSLVGVLACVVWVPTEAGSRCWPIRSFHSRHPDRNAVRKAARMRLRRDQHPVTAPNSHLSATLRIARVAGAELNANASGSPRSSARPSLHPHAALPRPRLDKSAEIKVVRAFQTPEPGSPPVRHPHQSCPDDLLPLFARYMLVICPTGGRLERERARASTQASLCSLVFNTNTDQPRRLPITLVETGLTVGAEDEMRSHTSKLAASPPIRELELVGASRDAQFLCSSGKFWLQLHHGLASCAGPFHHPDSASRHHCTICADTTSTYILSTELAHSITR